MENYAVHVERAFGLKITENPMSTPIVSKVLKTIAPSSMTKLTQFFFIILQYFRYTFQTFKITVIQSKSLIFSDELPQNRIPVIDASKNAKLTFTVKLRLPTTYGENQTVSYEIQFSVYMRLFTEARRNRI